jgi:hypothetical protein
MSCINTDMATYTDYEFWHRIGDRLHLLPDNIRDLIFENIAKNTDARNLIILIQQSTSREHRFDKVKEQCIKEILQVLRECQSASHKQNNFKINKHPSMYRDMCC